VTVNNQELQYIDLGVGRMTCDDCVRTVTDALQSVPGVQGADVSLERRSARVAVDSSVEPERLTAAVRASGYHAFVRSGGTRA
jgi:copper chaperone CopZ